MKIKIKLLGIICILGTSLLASTSVSAKNNINIHRLSGADRYGTSSAIISQGWTQSNYAILVNSQNFPDAITASPLAKKYNAPILLTDVNALTDSTKQELQTLGVKNVIIIGGTGSVSSDIESTLQSMGITTNRIWGQDRYETSVNVAKALGTSNGAFVVSGEHYEDALSVAPIADKLQYPVILISQDSVPAVVKDYISNIKNNGGEVDVVGGPDVLTDTVASELKPTTVYNQATKYDRNLALINNYKGQLDLSKVYIASDKGFADALSGSALAGMNGNPIILVGDSNQSNVNSFISSNNVSNVDVLGGTGVLSDDTIANITSETGINSNNSSDASNKKTTPTSANIDPAIVSDLIIGPAADPNATVVLVQLGVSNPSDYTVIVKGVTATFDPAVDDFIATVKVPSKTITFTESDFAITNNGTTSTISEINNISDTVDQKVINFPDKNLELVIRDAIGKPTGDIYKSDVEKITSLDSEFHHIKNISGIENLDNLQTLSFNGNQISDISPLKGLTKLQTLNLERNKISDISPLEGLSNLQKLFLYRNQISDISPLKGLVNLTFLSVGHNQISDISALKGLINLQRLILFRNQISDISPLKGLINLQTLALFENQISDADIQLLKNALPKCRVDS